MPENDGPVHTPYSACLCLWPAVPAARHEDADTHDTLSNPVWNPVRPASVANDQALPFHRAAMDRAFGDPAI
jgi:hypothetical protein